MIGKSMPHRMTSRAMRSGFPLSTTNAERVCAEIMLNQPRAIAVELERGRWILVLMHRGAGFRLNTLWIGFGRVARERDQQQSNHGHAGKHGPGFVDAQRERGLF